MNIYSENLKRKLFELNGGYPAEFMSIGRLVTIAGNPYGLYPGLSDSNRHEIAKVIRGIHDDRTNSLSYESLNVAQNFVNELLKDKLGVYIPQINTSQFRDIVTYQDLFDDLARIKKPKDVNLTSCAQDNLKMFLDSPNSGFFKGKLDDKLIMSSFEPKDGPILRISYRTKTRNSFVEKALERFVRFDRDVVLQTYLVPHVGKITGKEIFLDYFRRFKNSGLDLYEFWNRENPNYLSGEALDKFKEKFIAIFPVDHDGAKVIVKTRADAEYLAKEILNEGINRYKGFPIHLKLCEDNLGHSQNCECKDGSYTLGIGARTTKRHGNTERLINSGMTEIKIQPYYNAIESEFGSSMHITYKGEKKHELKCLLQGVDPTNHLKSIPINKDYVYYYQFLCRTFKIPPILLTEKIY